MNKSYLLIFYMLFIYTYLHAEFEFKNISARVSAMGGAYIALADDPAAVYYNPAGIAINYRREMLSSYTRLFNIDELIHQYIAFTTPMLPTMNLGFGVNRFGTGKYQENIYTFGLAREFSKHHWIGISINHFESKIENTKDHQSHGIDFGIISGLGNKGRIALLIKNLNSPNVNEQLKSYYRLGFLFYPINKLKLVLDIEKAMTVINQNRISLHIGNELKIQDGIFFRLGYKNRPNRLSFGFGVWKGNVKIDYSFVSHTDLNATHQVSMGIRF